MGVGGERGERRVGGERVEWGGRGERERGEGGEYGDYERDGCHPSPLPTVAVGGAEADLLYHMESQVSV